MCVEGLSVDSEYNVQQLTLRAEGSEALQEAGAMAGRREGAFEGSIFVSHAAGEQGGERIRGLRAGWSQPGDPGQLTQALKLPQAQAKSPEPPPEKWKQDLGPNCVCHLPINWPWLDAICCL